MKNKKRTLLMIFVLSVVLGALVWLLKDYYCFSCGDEEIGNDNKLIEKSIEKIFE